MRSGYEFARVRSATGIIVHKRGTGGRGSGIVIVGSAEPFHGRV